MKLFRHKSRYEGKYATQKEKTPDKEKNAPSKNTARALLLSTLSLCVSMFFMAGSTLAWYSSTVESSVQVIQSGELSVAAQYSTTPDVEESWKDVDGQNIFHLGGDQILVPGETATVYLRVRNTGDMDANIRLWLDAEDAPGDSVNALEDLLCNVQSSTTCPVGVPAEQEYIPYDTYISNASLGNQTYKLVKEAAGAASSYQYYRICLKKAANEAVAGNVQVRVRITADQIRANDDTTYVPHDAYAVDDLNDLITALALGKKNIALTQSLELTDDLEISGEVNIYGAGLATIFCKGHNLKLSGTVNVYDTVIVQEANTTNPALETTGMVSLNGCTITAKGTAGTAVKATSGGLTIRKSTLKAFCCISGWSDGSTQNPNVVVVDSRLTVENANPAALALTVGTYTDAEGVTHSYNTHFSLIDTGIYTTNSADARTSQWHNVNLITTKNCVYNGQPIS